MLKAQNFLVRLSLSLVAVGIVLPSARASSDLPYAEVAELREVFESIEDSTAELTDALGRFFTDRQRKRLSEKLVESNQKVFELFSSLAKIVRSRGAALEFSELVDEFLEIHQHELSSSYVDWPFAGFQIDGADHLDDGQDVLEAARESLHKRRLKLLSKWGLHTTSD